MGAGEGQQDFFRFARMMTAASVGGDFSLKTFVEMGLKELDPVAELEQEPNMPAGYFVGSAAASNAPWSAAVETLSAVSVPSAAAPSSTSM